MSMIQKTVNYEWSWKCLSLFRNTHRSRTTESWVMDEGGDSSRIFTLKPSWVWWYWKDRWCVWTGLYPEDPMEICWQWFKRWCKLNHTNTDDGDFPEFLAWYSVQSFPGDLLRLNPALLY